MNEQDRLVKLASSAAEWLAKKECAFVDRVAGDRSQLIAPYAAHAAFLVNALGILPATARAYTAAQLEKLDEEPYDQDAFEGSTYRSLVSLALGEEPAPVDPLKRGLRQVARALEARSQTINVALPAVHIAIKQPQQTINVEVPAPAVPKQDKPWATRTTIIQRDSEGRADVIETTPIEE